MRKIKVAICSHQADSPLCVAWCLIWWFASLEKYGHTWHQMSSLRQGVNKCLKQYSYQVQPHFARTVWMDGWMNGVLGYFLHYQGWIGPGTTWTNEMKLGWNIAPVQYRSLDPPHCSSPRYKWASSRPHTVWKCYNRYNFIPTAIANCSRISMGTVSSIMGQETIFQSTHNYLLCVKQTLYWQLYDSDSSESWAPNLYLWCANEVNIGY